MASEPSIGIMCGNHRELLEPETVFNDVAGMQDDNGGGGVGIDVLVVIAISLLALGIVVGEWDVVGVLFSAMLDHYFSHTLLYGFKIQMDI